jgi:hypothetical protein
MTTLMLDTWFSIHRAHRDTWSKIDALKLNKLLSKRGLKAPPWFAGSPRAAQKLKVKHPQGESLLASTDLAEMASRREVAIRRYENLSPHWKNIQQAEFPACGAGLDALHFADFLGSECPSIVVGDISDLATAIAQENFDICGISGQVYSYDALKPTHESPDQTYIFLDPARRDGEDSLERYHYLPNLDEAMPMLERVDFAQIKLAPGESPDRLLRYTEAGWSWQWVQLGKDLLECSGTWIHPRHRSPDFEPTWSATRFVDGRAHTWSSPVDVAPQASFALPQPWERGQVLFQPCKALRQSQLLSLWSQSQKLQSSCFEGLWLSAEGGLAHESQGQHLADVFVLEHACIANPKKLSKELKAWKDYPCELRSELQHTPEDVVQKIQPMLKQKGDPSERRTLLLSNDGHKNWLLVLKARYRLSLKGSD